MTDRTATIAAGGDGAERRQCRFCGAVLETRSAAAGGLCGSEACHARMIEESGLAIVARKRARYDAELADIADAIAPEIARAREHSGETAHIAVVPSQDGPLEPLADSRRAAFRRHLKGIVAFAFGQDIPPADSQARAAGEPEEGPEVDAACTTCRGWCCRRGGDTALLLPADMSRYRRRSPDATPDDIVAAYLSHLPETSARDACVYLTGHGCALPRPMRQDICNAYYCDQLRWLRKAWREAGTGRAVIVAAHKGESRRIATIDPETGYRPHGQPGEER